MTVHNLTTRTGSIVLLGAFTDPADRDRWSTITAWARGHDVEPVHACSEDALVAIATDDVLDGLCTPDEAQTLQEVRRRGIPCVGLDDAARELSCLHPPTR